MKLTHWGMCQCGRRREMGKQRSGPRRVNFKWENEETVRRLKDKGGVRREGGQRRQGRRKETRRLAERRSVEGRERLRVRRLNEGTKRLKRRDDISSKKKRTPTGLSHGRGKS